MDKEGNVKEEGFLNWTPGEKKWGFQTPNTGIAEALRDVGKRGTVDKRVAYQDANMIADGVQPVEASDESFLGALRDHLRSAGVLSFKVVEDGS